VDEISVNPYRICYECKHVFQTAEELVAVFNATGRQSAEECNKWMAKEWDNWEPVQFEPVDDAEQVFFCPLCMHDF
jgi:hypothetical protein